MPRKYHCNDCLIFHAIYEVQSADSATALRILYDDKLREVYVTGVFVIVRT